MLSAVTTLTALHSALAMITDNQPIVVSKDRVEEIVRSVSERNVKQEHVWHDDDVFISCAPTIDLRPFKLCSTQTKKN